MAAAAAREEGAGPAATEALASVLTATGTRMIRDAIVMVAGSGRGAATVAGGATGVMGLTAGPADGADTAGPFVCYVLVRSEFSAARLMSQPAMAVTGVMAEGLVLDTRAASGEKGLVNPRVRVATVVMPVYRACRAGVVRVAMPALS